MTLYRGFPRRPHHDVPNWVEDGALFHIRIALDRRVKQAPLTNPSLATAILESALFYETMRRWYVTIFVLMPDHLHALASFDRRESMSNVVRVWKRFHARNNGIIWQEGYFDHRLRDDERGAQFSIKVNYIRQNPVVAGLCRTADQWPWKIDRFE